MRAPISVTNRKDASSKEYIPYIDGFTISCRPIPGINHLLMKGLGTRVPPVGEISPVRNVKNTSKKRTDIITDERVGTR